MADGDGDSARDNARDFFQLEWLLNPGGDARARELRNQERATDLWLAQWGRTPREEQLYREEQLVDGGQSALSDGAIRGNTEYTQGRDAQLTALRQMQGIAEAGGYTPLERAQIAQAQRQAAQYEQQQRQAQLQQMEMRGLQGGGVELASRLAAQQGGANRSAQSATDIATAAQQRALQAMQAGGQIGAGVQQNAQTRGAALDAFNAANTARAQGVQQRNVGNRQQATRDYAQYNLDVIAGATGQYNANAGAAGRQAEHQGNLVSGLLGAVV